MKKKLTINDAIAKIVSKEKDANVSQALNQFYTWLQEQTPIWTQLLNAGMGLAGLFKVELVRDGYKLEIVVLYDDVFIIEIHPYLRNSQTYHSFRTNLFQSHFLLKKNTGIFKKSIVAQIKDDYDLNLQNFKDKINNIFTKYLLAKREQTVQLVLLEGLINVALKQEQQTRNQVTLLKRILKRMEIAKKDSFDRDDLPDDELDFDTILNDENTKRDLLLFLIQAENSVLTIPGLNKEPISIKELITIFKETMQELAEEKPVELNIDNNANNSSLQNLSNPSFYKLFYKNLFIRLQKVLLEKQLAKPAEYEPSKIFKR